MTFLKRILILIIAFNSLLAFSQNTIYIKGYVIHGSYILPNVLVSVAKKDVSTHTNFKGYFKIQCLIGDTLIFEKEYSNYKIEKYCVKDSSLLIVELIEKVELDNEGRRKLYGSVRAILREKRTFSFSGSITDKNIYSCGYSYYPDPFFPDKPFIPIMNNISFGLSISKYDNSCCLYPNIGLLIRNNYKDLFGSNASFSFIVPSVKIGYWLNCFETGRNGFGYELGIILADISVFREHLTVDLNYNSYLTANGTFMISINFRSFTKPNEIQSFIKKQISK